MRKSNAENLSEIIHQFLRQEGLETPYNEYKAVQAWNNVVGERFSKYTGNVFMKNQTLYVEIKSAAAKQELQMRKTSLIEQINNAVGAKVVYDIHFK